MPIFKTFQSMFDILYSKNYFLYFKQELDGTKNFQKLMLLNI